MAFQLCAQALLIRTSSSEQHEKEVALPITVFSITNAFITATLKSHGELRLTSFLHYLKRHKLFYGMVRSLKSRGMKKLPYF